MNSPADAKIASSRKKSSRESSPVCGRDLTSDSFDALFASSFESPESPFALPESRSVAVTVSDVVSLSPDRVGAVVSSGVKSLTKVTVHGSSYP